MSGSTDRIEKEIVLAAPRARVWRALTTASAFGEWLGAKLTEPFVEGGVSRGPITHPGFDHLTLEMRIVRIQPEEYFAFRWHPHAVDQRHDYAAEPDTLVEFRLAEVPGGTRLTIVESGFDKVPLARRAVAFRANDGGWTELAGTVERHVAKSK